MTNEIQNSKLIKSIDARLDRYLPSNKEEPIVLHKAMRYSVFPGGKRIRPVILIEAAIACGAKAGDAVPAAAAVELVHAYSLIHDDLPSMDDDDYRRGKLSCHKKFGEANAILAGDALLTLAFDIIANEYLPAAGIKMIKELSCAIGSKGMVGGQAMDIAEYKDKRKVNRLKTAKLFAASAALGAISAGASASKIKAMRRFGANFGMKFQAADDAADKAQDLRRIK
jgi:geranylgeranyl diphosphate synthase type II